VVTGGESGDEVGEVLEVKRVPVNGKVGGRRIEGADARHAEVEEPGRGGDKRRVEVLGRLDLEDDRFARSDVGLEELVLFDDLPMIVVLRRLELVPGERELRSIDLRPIDSAQLTADLRGGDDDAADVSGPSTALGPARSGVRCRAARPGASARR